MSIRARLGDELLKLPAAWQDEIAARVQRVDAGTVELEDGPTVMRGLRNKHARGSTVPPGERVPLPSGRTTT